FRVRRLRRKPPRPKRTFCARLDPTRARKSQTAIGAFTLFGSRPTRTYIMPTLSYNVRGGPCPGAALPAQSAAPLLRIVSAMLRRFDAAAPADTLLIHSRAQIGLADYCRLRGVPFDAVLRESGLETETVSASLGGHISLRAHSSALEAASRLADD